MSRISVDTTTRLAFDRLGRGAPLLLIGGMGCDRHFWGKPQLQRLAEDYDVVVFDNHGIGESDVPPGPCTIEAMADDATGLLNELDIDSVHVLGFSMGAMIALQLAARHPTAVRSLFVASGTARSDAWMKYKQVFNERLLSLVPDDTAFRELRARMNLLWMFSSEFCARSDAVEQVLSRMQASDQSREGYLWQSHALQRHDATAVLSQVRCPTLVVVGSEDILTPIRYAKEIAGGIPGAELRVIDGVGHAWMIEKPDVFTSCVLDFLARVDSASRAGSQVDEATGAT